MIVLNKTLGRVHFNAVSAVEAVNEQEKRIHITELSGVARSAGDIILTFMLTTKRDFWEGVEEFLTPDEDLPKLMASRQINSSKVEQ